MLDQLYQSNDLRRMITGRRRFLSGGLEPSGTTLFGASICSRIKPYKLAQPFVALTCGVRRFATPSTGLTTCMTKWSPAPFAA